MGRYVRVWRVRCSGVEPEPGRLLRIDDPEPRSGDFSRLRRGLWLVIWAHIFLALDLWIEKDIRVDLISDIVGAFMLVAGVAMARRAFPAARSAAMTWAFAGAWARVLLAVLDHAPGFGAGYPAVGVALHFAGGTGDAAFCFALARLVAALGWSPLDARFRLCAWLVTAYMGSASCFALAVQRRNLSASSEEAGVLYLVAAAGIGVGLFELVLLYRTAKRCAGGSATTDQSANYEASAPDA